MIVDVYPTAKPFHAEMAALRTPPAGTLRKRPAAGKWNQEEEKREDFPSELRCDDTTKRTSPRSSPIAVLKLRRSNLFPEEPGHPTTPITVTYSSPSSDSDSRSIASSMFLVSPLRPLGRPQRVSEPSQSKVARNLKAALIDSSRTFLRPLTPPQHKPKRSLSDPRLFDDDDDVNEQPDNFQPPKFTRTQSIDTSSSRRSSSKQRRWLISADHPYKILWDILTFILSFANVYATHTSIRDRQFGNSWFMTFSEAWFVLDILLNFFTEYRSGSYALRDCRSVWARYLTTWFVVDVLSLFPGETLYLQPIIDQHNRRGFFKKNFFRTKGFLRVTRILRGRHVRIFGQAANQTKHMGVGAARLLQLLIKYIPRYLLFFRNMKGLLVLRMLRQVHWFRKIWRNFRGLDNGKGENQTTAPPSLRKIRRRQYNEDDDGVPF
jgi:hypothetical protein